MSTIVEPKTVGKRSHHQADVMLGCRRPISHRLCLYAVLLLLLPIILHHVASAAAVVTATTFSLSSTHTGNAVGRWAKQQSGTLTRLRAVHFLDENKGWAVGGSGALLTTVDGGKKWQVKRRPTEDILRDVYFTDEETGWLVCERSIYLLKTNDEQRGYLLHTTDGGTTWLRLNVTGSDVEARLVRIIFSDNQNGWTFGEAGALYATVDGGASWKKQYIATKRLLLGGRFLNAQQGWLVGAGASMLLTSDGGQTWQEGTVNNLAGVRFNAVSFVDERRGWVVGSEGRVFATTNGGHTWRAQTSNVRADLFDVKFTDASEGWAVGAEGTVIHTMDGGVNWQVEPSSTTHPLDRVCFVNREHGWAVGFGGTVIAYTAAALQKAAPKPPAQ